MTKEFQKPAVDADTVDEKSEYSFSQRGNLPIYQQLHVVLSRKLLDGEFPPGKPIPGELELARRFAVSRVTVRKTLSLLENDGLVSRRRGVGTYPVERTDDHSPKSLNGVLENLITIGVHTTAKTLSFGWHVPPTLPKRALGLGPDDVALRLERLRFNNGEPFSLTTVWIAPSFGKYFNEVDISSKLSIQVLEENGVHAHSAEQTLSAVAADDAAAAALGVDIGAPLIRLNRTVKREDGAGLLFQQSLYVPSRYEYHMMLRRDRNATGPHWRHVH
ncbi:MULTISPECIES: GntR family transcriptional regulator [Alphaproteobacteria]|nr:MULTISPECIES: GntR family transcriptional regulator [Alphaproteobacteria]HTO34476.1 GntR family transcriptional regulator [Pararhizobium sp.]